MGTEENQVVVRRFIENVAFGRDIGCPRRTNGYRLC
jgi:hypothetical protein